MTAFQTAEYDGLPGPPARLVTRVARPNRHFMPSPTSPCRAGLVLALVALVAGTVAVRPAGAQPVGVRASGLAGAFVAVADDASSVYWNPAGMATGAFVSFVLDYGEGESRPGSAGGGGDTGGGADHQARMLAFTLPPLGIGYYRLQTVTAGPARTEEMDGPDREVGRRNLLGLTTSNVGVTLAQSISQYMVVASTIRYVSGEVVEGAISGRNLEDALDAASGLPSRSTSRVDVDAGLMVAVEQVRLGLVARNLMRPSFHGPDTGAGAGTVEMDREVRVGAAWGNRWPGNANLVVSADADLTSRASPSGDRRDLAAGVETWWLQRRLGVRGGVRGSTLGEGRMVVATGLSAAIASGIYIEAHAAAGESRERSWSLGARFTF